MSGNKSDFTRNFIFIIMEDHLSGCFESSFVHYINSLWRGDTIRQHKSGLTSPDSTKSLPEPIFTNHQ